MSAQFLVALATTLVEHEDLVALYERSLHLAHYLCALNCRSTYGYCTFIVNQQYFLKLNCLLSLSVLNVVNEETFALLCLELLTVNFYDYVPLFLLCIKRVSTTGRSIACPLVLEPACHKSAAKVVKNWQLTIEN